MQALQSWWERHGWVSAALVWVPAQALAHVYGLVCALAQVWGALQEQASEQASGAPQEQASGLASGALQERASARAWGALREQASELVLEPQRVLQLAQGPQPGRVPALQLARPRRALPVQRVPQAQGPPERQLRPQQLQARAPQPLVQPRLAPLLPQQQESQPQPPPPSAQHPNTPCRLHSH